MSEAEDEQTVQSIPMELDTNDTGSNGHSIHTNITAGASDRKKQEMSEIMDAQTVQSVTMELEKPQTDSNRHSIHTHIADASDRKKGVMPEVEDVQTIQSVAIELDTPDTNSTVKHGQDILMPPSVKFSDACIWNSLYLFIILVSSILLTIPSTLLPLHNAIKHPKYWWELIIPAAVGVPIYDALNMVLECQLIFTFEIFKSFKVFLRLYCLNSLTIIITIVVCFIIWTVWMGNNHPIPFLGGILYVVSIITQCITLWFQFPYQLRIKNEVRDRIWAYLLYRLWFRFYGVQTIGLKTMMVMLPLEIQWIMAIVLPIHRELNLWVIIKLLEKSTDYTTTVPLIPKLTATTLVNLGHAINVAGIISSMATEITSYSILTVDFMMNLFLLHNIIRLHRNITPTDASENERRMIEKTENIMILFAIETVEFLTPIIYSLTFAIAYYGPNAEMIGGIKGDFWKFKIIEDMTSFQTNLFLMFAIDFVSAIISGLALWKFCSTDFLHEGYKMMKIFFPILAVKWGGIFMQAGYF